MANLITQKQKRNVRVDYIIRYISVSFLMLSLLGLFLLAYVIPYYFSVYEQDIKAGEQFESLILIENKENVGESASRVVNLTLDQIKAIELYNQDSINPSAHFLKIINNKNNNISLTKLSFSLITKKQAQFLVSGIAKNREGLVIFIEDLKNQGDFTNVESPVSDFAKDSDIAFTLNLKKLIQ